MKLAQAAAWFNHTPLAGWDGSAWVPDIAWGSFQVYDRFISDREFGQKKRVFTCGDGEAIDSAYLAVRSPDGNIYLVSSVNTDVQGTEVYNRTYMLMLAGFVADVYSVVTGTAPSGVARNATPVLDATLHCDLARYGASSSREVGDLRLTLHEVTLPASYPVTTSHYLVIDEVRYTVQEAFRELDLVVLRCAKRGAGA